MKIFFLLLFTALIFTSCGKNGKNQFTNEDTFKDKVDTTAAELKIIDDNFLDNPFQLGKVNIKNLRNQFNDLIIEKEPIKNLHINDQVDTILTVKADNSEFIIYKLPKVEFLESASIKDKNIKLNNDIFVGMSKDQFKLKFEGLKGRRKIPSKIIISRKEAQEFMVFNFAEDVLKTIDFVGYVD